MGRSNRHGVFSKCTTAEWDDWYLKVVALGTCDGAEDMRFLETVGQELKAHGVSFASQWELPLDDLQMGRLRNRLREADLQVTDISTDASYKDRKREWWYAEGSKYCDRLMGKFSVATRDVLTPDMMTGVSLSPTECREVVADKRFETWEAKLQKSDYKKAARYKVPKIKDLYPVPGKHHSADCQPADTLTAAAVDGSGNVPNNGVTSQTTAAAVLAYVTL